MVKEDNHAHKLSHKDNIKVMMKSLLEDRYSCDQALSRARKDFLLSLLDQLKLKKRKLYCSNGPK